MEINIKCFHGFKVFLFLNDFFYIYIITFILAIFKNSLSQLKLLNTISHILTNILETQ